MAQMNRDNRPFFHQWDDLRTPGMNTAERVQPTNVAAGNHPTRRKSFRTGSLKEDTSIKKMTVALL
jgi:hypothetical protein